MMGWLATQARALRTFTRDERGSMTTEFVLWVPADAPYASVGEFVDALRRGEDGAFKMAGTGSKPEDQLIVTALEGVAVTVSATTLTDAKLIVFRDELPYNETGKLLRRQVRAELAEG